MAAGQVPFEGFNGEMLCKDVAQGGKRPPTMPEWPQSFSNLLQACWHADPNMRPVRTLSKSVGVL